MDRVARVMQHELFVEYTKKIEACELDRVFCLHGIEHSLDVARISYIINLEQSCNHKKDVIYSMALLHDLGRAIEYTNGDNHHEAGADIAAAILKDSGFDEMEIADISHAIASHKHLTTEDTSSLGSILYRADKLSRNCFNCKAYDDCYWSREQKNSFVSI